jgi:5-methylcytosine-specific restriction endonuclease McrA
MTADEKRRYKEAHLVRYQKRMLKKNPNYFNQIKGEQKSSPIIQERQRLRSNFSSSFRRYRETKVDTMSKMIGCTWAFFASWIESKFTKKMKWENYGSHWHIDHINPLAAFDVYNNEHMRRAWHYTNLRPLSAKENSIKGAKIITHQPELIMVIH